jgi:hypothetical protein
VALEPDPDENLIAAAEAAASWARARRAKWTNEPVRATEPYRPEPQASEAQRPEPHRHEPHRPEPPVADEPFDFEFEPQHDLPPVTFEPQPTAVIKAPPAPARRRAKPLSGIGAPLVRWLPRIAAAAALIIGAVVGAPYALNALSSLKTRAAPPPDRRREQPRAVPRKPTGTLSVTSSPSGANVSVDGKPRGVTPLELSDVTPGRHEIALTSASGSVRRTVNIAADKTVSIDEAIFSGFVAVYSPFEITVAEGGRVLRPDDRNEIMLSPGVHDLRFINKTLGFDEARKVEVKPGEGTPVRLTPNPSTLNVTASDAAEVWIDGTRVGEVPLTGASVTLGTHEVVLRRTSDGTERRSTITVGVAPLVLHVDFSHSGA